VFATPAPLPVVAVNLHGSAGQVNAAIVAGGPLSDGELGGEEVVRVMRVGHFDEHLIKFQILEEEAIAEIVRQQESGFDEEFFACAFECHM
jgi:hypothetical protein